MYKVNEELIGKDSVKKKAAFLEAQTFATDEPQDEGVGEQIEMVREQIAKAQSKQTKNAFDFNTSPPLEGPGVGNDDEDNLESPDSQNHAGEEEIIDDEDVKPSEDTTEQWEGVSERPLRSSVNSQASHAVEYPHQSATTVARAGKRKGDNKGETSFPGEGVVANASHAGEGVVANASHAQAGIKPQSMPSSPEPAKEQEGWMGNLELILDIPLQIDVQIGKTKVPLREVLELSSGSIIKLNKSESDSVDLLINGKLVAEGQIVLTDQNTLGIQVTSIVNRVERIRSLR